MRIYVLHFTVVFVGGIEEILKVSRIRPFSLKNSA